MLGGTFVHVSQSDEIQAFLNQSNLPKQEYPTPERAQKKSDVNPDCQDSKINLFIVGTNMQKSPP